jgi:muramoyltetrapeptide carboxypeptidase
MRSLKLLKRGDKVGLIAPGSTFNREKFDKGVSYLKKLGLIPVYGPHLFAKDFIFAGTVKQRVHSLRVMLKRRDIKALWCVRGGAGAYAVAEEIAKDKAPRYPKIVIGMSDVTALHILMVQKWKWPVLHAPLFDRIGTDLRAREQETLEETLFNPSFRFKETSGLGGMGKKKTVTGQLVGGNLALVAASLGSSWEIDTRNKILFLEDTGERAYRIDRMLTQLRSAGKFDSVKGIIFGDFTECTELDGKELWKNVLKRHFSKSSIPCLIGIRAGHGDLRLTIPFGLNVRLTNTSRRSFEVLEGLIRG